MKAIRLALLFVGLTASGSAYSDSIDDSLFAPEEKCAYCHAADGNSVMSRFPRLGGQRLDYLLKQLRDFRSGRRHNDENVMLTNAEQLSDNDILRVARYFSEQTPAVHDPRADGSPGSVLYWQGKGEIAPCVQCHSGTAGNQDRPAIAGQHGGYLMKQLRDLRSGKRTNDPDAAMQAVARKLTATDIDALVRYLMFSARTE